MAIEFKKTAYSGRFPEFWRGEAKILPGGFKPVQNFANGTVVRRGTPLFVDFEQHSAAVCKTATVLAGGTTSAVRVAKGHLFQVGDYVTKYGNGTAAKLINGIDTTNAEYDVLSLNSAYAGLVANDIIVETTEAKVDGAETFAPKYEPNFVAGADKEFNGKGLPALDAAYDVVVLYPALAFPILAEWLNGANCLKLNPNILFIKQ